MLVFQTIYLNIVAWFVIISYFPTTLGRKLAKMYTKKDEVSVQW